MIRVFVIASCFMLAACNHKVNHCEWHRNTDQTKQEQIFFDCVNMLPHGSHHDLGQAIKECRKTSYELATDKDPVWVCKEIEVSL